MNANPEVISTLVAIAEKNHGVLTPEAVVDHAKRDDSPLHGRFTWDDSEAAHQYRLWQARQLIRVTIKYLPNGSETIPARIFVSLTTDRTNDGGGYRHIVDVMSDKDMKAQLLRDALDELVRFETKYAALKELADVFQAARKARKDLFELVGRA